MAQRALTLQFTNGVEGPRHDPYGWDEVQYTCPATGRIYVLRTSALGYERLTVINGALAHTLAQLTQHTDRTKLTLVRLFEALVGLSAAELDIAREQDAACKEDLMGSIES